MRGIGVFALAMVLVAACPARPQGVEAATRGDVGFAFLRLERALAANGMANLALREANERFDAVTGLFFSGRMAPAIRALNELAADATGAEPSDAMRVAESLVVRVEPSILILDEPMPVRAVLRRLYETDAVEPVELTVSLRRADGEEAGAGQAIVRHGVSEIGIDVDGASPGRYDVVLSTGAGESMIAGVWCVTRERPSRTRAQVEARLAGASVPAATACRARAGLLEDEILYESSSSILLDPAGLAGEVEQESRAIADGRDPYKGRTGDWWAVFEAGGEAVPARIFVPEGTEAPVPLVIVLHGAGGDENLFMEGYGGGMLKRLARERGFIALSPLTYPIAAREAAVPALIDAVASIAPVDRGRVYVLGHSLGGGAASFHAVRSRDVLAAVACIAGAGPVASAPACAPTRIYGAELDRIIPAARLEDMAVRAGAGGLPVEYRLVGDAGHTLVVMGVMEEAIDWMLGHRRERP